jgi:hypothetical protein
MRGFLAALVVALLLSGCDAALSRAPSGLQSRTVAARSEVVAAEETWSPSTAAERITTLERRITRKLERWQQEGRPRSGELWRSMLVLGVRAQKTYRRFVPRPKVARKIERHLDGLMAWRFRANIKAARRLYTISSPVDGPVHMPTTRPEHPTKLLRFFKKGQRRFGVPWYILASVNLVETRFGRLTGPSSAGALGPMQFMPATWDAYGTGNIMDPHDSIMAAARYLAANGAPGNMRNALWHYNHSWAYVDAIQIYARQMRARIRNYYGYYLWQVFVRTTKGDLQLTGPGS